MDHGKGLNTKLYGMCKVCLVGLNIFRVPFIYSALPTSSVLPIHWFIFYFLFLSLCFCLSHSVVALSTQLFSLLLKFPPCPLLVQLHISLSHWLILHSRNVQRFSHAVFSRTPQGHSQASTAWIKVFCPSMCRPLCGYLWVYRLVSKNRIVQSQGVFIFVRSH